jgi:hypothetical protein
MVAVGKKEKEYSNCHTLVFETLKSWEQEVEKTLFMIV